MGSFSYASSPAMAWQMHTGDAPTSVSSEDDIEKFYNELQNAKDKRPAKEMCIMIGDFNAKIGGDA